MLRDTLLALATASALAAASLSAGPSAVAASGTAGITPAAPTPAIAQVDDAVATAVIAGISSQFDADDVTVQLGRIDVRPASIQDRRVEGTGRLRIGQGDWIPFRFATLYDTRNRDVAYPRLRLDVPRGTPLLQDASVARSFDRAVERALAAEFPEQRVQWTLARANQAEAGRYVRVEGTGTADFGADGTTPARVDGLYDRTAGRWVRVHYALGDEAAWDAPQAGLAAL